MFKSAILLSVFQCHLKKKKIKTSLILFLYAISKAFWTQHVKCENIGTSMILLLENKIHYFFIFFLHVSVNALVLTVVI